MYLIKTGLDRHLFIPLFEKHLCLSEEIHTPETVANKIEKNVFHERGPEHDGGPKPAMGDAVSCHKV